MEIFFVVFVLFCFFGVFLFLYFLGFFLFVGLVWFFVCLVLGFLFFFFCREKEGGNSQSELYFIERWAEDVRILFEYCRHWVSLIPLC